MSEIDAMTAFEYNIAKPKGLLELTRSSGIRDRFYGLLDSIPKGPLGFLLGTREAGAFLDSIETAVGAHLDDYLQVIDETCYELAIGSAVTALETYLHQVYQGKSKQEYVGKPLLDVGIIEETFDKFGIPVFDSDEMRREVEPVFEMRRVIVHGAGIIDERACQIAGWPEEAVGANVRRFLSY